MSFVALLAQLVFRAQLGGDLEAFYREVSVLGKLAKAERHRRLRP